MDESRKQVDIERVRGLLPDKETRPKDFNNIVEEISRRGFLWKTGVAAVLTGFGAGTAAALKGLFEQGLLPVAWAGEPDKHIPGKPDMVVHNTHPINGEFPPHLLDDDITPSERHFVRNNGFVPQRAQDRDIQGWTLKVDGEVHQPLALTMEELKALPAVTKTLPIECGGNGRANFTPKVRGNPWDRGAIACSEWTGVPLKVILERAELKSSAVYTAHYGEDQPLGKAEPFSRGIPIKKAMEEHTLVAYQMNGKDLTSLNGFPVRLVVPGWIGSCSQKWLTRVWVRDQVHDSYKMRGYSYRIPKYPVVPGSKPPKSDMAIVTVWQIKSMITRPAINTHVKLGGTVPVRGHAWAGEDAVKEVFLSIDFGLTWTKAALKEPPNKYAWYTFETHITFPNKGYYEIWARATDDQGKTQPIVQPWNPKGYLGNVIHRVPVLVGL